MLRLAKMSDIPDLLAFIRQDIHELHQEGQYWISQDYPAEVHFATDIHQGRCWVYEAEGKAVATVGGTLVQSPEDFLEMEKEPHGDPWLSIPFQGGYPYYLFFRGFVSKAYSGNHYLSLLMAQHRSLAIQGKARSMIVCTDVKNTKVNHNFLQNGFLLRGTSLGEGFEGKTYTLNYYETMLPQETADQGGPHSGEQL